MSLLRLELANPVMLEELLKLPDLVNVQVNRALQQSAASILNNLRTGFLAQTDPHGLKWKPSKAGQEREARGTGFTLFDTGNLFRSIQLSKDGDNAMSISTDVPYAKPLQEGRPGHPPREFLTLATAHVEMAERIFAMRLKEIGFE